MSDPIRCPRCDAELTVLARTTSRCRRCRAVIEPGWIATTDLFASIVVCVAVWIGSAALGVLATDELADRRGPFLTAALLGALPLVTLLGVMLLRRRNLRVAKPHVTPREALRLGLAVFLVVAVMSFAFAAVVRVGLSRLADRMAAGRGAASRRRRRTARPAAARRAYVVPRGRPPALVHRAGAEGHPGRDGARRGGGSGHRPSRTVRRTTGRPAGLGCGGVVAQLVGDARALPRPAERRLPEADPCTSRPRPGPGSAPDPRDRSRSLHASR